MIQVGIRLPGGTEMLQNRKKPNIETLPESLPMVMIELIEIIERSLEKEMERNASPKHLARSAVIAVCDALGGMSMYLPKGATLERKLKDESIYDDFLSGIEHQEIINKYKASSQTVYKIISRERALRLEAQFKR